MIKVNTEGTRTTSQKHSGVFIITFEQISPIFSDVYIIDFEEVNVDWMGTLYSNKDQLSLVLVKY